ncbi:MAG: sigma-70 family RNA polymerase sigma factor [Trebonia sp.]
MRDSDIVASIVAAGPGGLAQAYDTYAPEVFAYCRTLLREPADAADAVRATFLAADSRLAGLRDPGRLRPWLYAVARNQCLHWIRSGEALPAASPVFEVGGETAGADGGAGHALQGLLRAAFGGLGPGEREVVTLTLWQGLDTAETADVLGISRHRVQFLLARARRQLAASVSVLLLSGAGRENCGGLDALFAGRDGLLTVALRERVSRHVARCTVCARQRQHEMQCALDGLAPGVALTALAAEAGREAAEVPDSLRILVLDAPAGRDRGGAAGGAELSYPGTFGKDGFPKPAARPQPWSRRVASAAAIAVAVAAATVVVIALSGSPRGHSASAGGAPGASGLGTPGNGNGTGPAAGRLHPSAGTAPGGRGGVTVAIAPSPAPAAGSPRPASRSAAPPATPAQGAAATVALSSASSSAPAGQGTLSVSPSSLVLAPLLGGTCTLTAVGGPVSWSISEPSSLPGELVVSPASGTLADGQSTRVTITVNGLVSLDTQLTVSPGGLQITVDPGG